MFITWPVSQTVKTLCSQRREYGFESHTGHHEKGALNVLLLCFGRSYDE